MCFISFHFQSLRILWPPFLLHVHLLLPTPTPCFSIYFLILMNRFSKSYLRRSMWEFWFWALTSLKITSFYPDTFWLGLKSQVGNNIRFWEVVLPVSASAISIAGGMLYLQVLWDFSLCLPYPGVYPLCSMGSFHLETHISHYSGIHLLLISSSMRLTLIFRCSFFILYKYHFSAPWVSVVVAAPSVPKLWLGSFQASASFSWLLVQVSGNPWLMLKGWEL